MSQQSSPEPFAVGGQTPRQSWRASLRAGLLAYHRGQIEAARVSFRAALREPDCPEEARRYLLYNLANCNLVLGDTIGLAGFEQGGTAAWSIVELTDPGILEQMGVSARQQALFLARLDVYAAFAQSYLPAGGVPANLVDRAGTEHELGSYGREDRDACAHLAAMRRAHNSVQAEVETPAADDSEGESPGEYRDQLTGLRLCRLPVVGWERAGLVPPPPPRPPWLWPWITRQHDWLDRAAPPGRSRIAASAVAGAVVALAYRLPFAPTYRSFSETQTGGPYWWAALLHLLIMGLAAAWLCGIWRRPASEPPSRMQLTPVGGIAFVSFVAALAGTTVWLIRPVDWLFSPLQGVPPSLAWALAGGVIVALGTWARQVQDDIGLLRRRVVVSATCALALLMLPRGLALLTKRQPLPPDAAFQAAAQLANAGKLRAAISKGEDVVRLTANPGWILQIESWYLQLARSERRAGLGDRWVEDAKRARTLSGQLADMPKARMEAATAAHEFTDFVDDVFKESDATRQRGNLDEATKIGEQAISLDPTSAVYKYITAFSYLKLATLCRQTAPPRVPGLNQRALRLAEDAVKLAPNNDTALAYYAAALLQNGNKTDAGLWARKALSANRDNQVARMVLDRTGGL